MKGMIWKYKYPILVIILLVVLFSIAHYRVTTGHFLSPRVLVSDKLVLSSDINEKEYNVSLKYGDILRIKIKVDGDPFNLYIYAPFNTTRFSGNYPFNIYHVWEHIFNDTRNQYSGSPPKRCRPLCPDGSFLFTDVIIIDGRYTFRIVLLGEHSEVDFRIAKIGWIRVGKM